jgi:predicted dehydrogenase
MALDNDLSRRDFVKTAGAATTAAAVLSAPAIRTAHAANEPVRYGIIGTGSRGNYLLRHLKDIPSGQLVAACDIQDESIKKLNTTIKESPWPERLNGKLRIYKDYRELLAQKDIDAVLITTPLFVHYPIAVAALDAGKHVFCEKCLVFKPEEVHGLRAVAANHPKQILQTGLQRRYSTFYQTVKQMVAKGILGDVKHMHAQWHRNMINKPSTLWTMKPNGEQNINNWRVFRSMSGGLVAELTSHQVDVADWMFGTSPEFVMGFGSLDSLKDGRNVYDNVQLIYRYPNGKQLTYSAISTSQFLPYFDAQRPEMGELIMGTDGAIAITLGDGPNKYEPRGKNCVAWWYREPPKEVKTADAKKKAEPFVAGATMVATGGAVRPIPIMTSDLEFGKSDSFLSREAKFARRWLTAKGILVQEEQTNAVDVELDAFFDSCRTGKKPLADLEIGMADAIAVILSNQAMDEGRKVYFNEIENMGRVTEVAKPAMKKA